MGIERPEMPTQINLPPTPCIAAKARHERFVLRGI